MLHFILIHVQYLLNDAFSFEKSLNGQNHSSADSDHPMKKFPSPKFTVLIPPGGEIPSTFLVLFGNLWHDSPFHHKVYK